MRLMVLAMVVVGLAGCSSGPSNAALEKRVATLEKQMESLIFLIETDLDSRLNASGPAPAMQRPTTFAPRSQPRAPGPCSICQGSGLSTMTCTVCKGSGLSRPGVACDLCKGRRFGCCLNCSGSGRSR